MDNTICGAALDQLSHTATLDDLSPKERLAHHRKQLQSIAFKDGMKGVHEYYRANPDAKQVRVHSQPRSYLPKPAGYSDYVATMVAAWLDSSEALAATNKADVERLNSNLGSDLDPRTHFSKPMTPAVRKKVQALCAERGLDVSGDDVETLGKVRSAIKRGKSSDASGTKPFGAIGSRSGDRLWVGGEDFKIETNGKRECIRPSINGTKRRLYLDDLLWFAELLLSEPPQGVSDYLLRSSTGDWAYSAKTPDEPSPEAPPSDQSPKRLGLSERIAALSPPETGPIWDASSGQPDPLAELPH